jgi:hypothetical protein
MDLKQQEKDDDNRRSQPMYQHAKKIQDSVLHNKNIVILDQGIELHPDPPDFEAAIILKANKLSMKVSTILELVHTNFWQFTKKFIH